jgi:Fic family protein
MLTLNISYNISPKLQGCLDKIEELRKQILLTPIPQEKELRLRWEATLNRTHYSLKLAGNSLKKTEMLKLLAEVTRKKISGDQEAVLRYKGALDYIVRNWQGSRNAVDAKSLIELHKTISNGRLRVPQAGLQYLLDYLQAKIESPVIQAAIINIELEKMQLFTEHNTLIANLSAYVFLYKYGYDLKGFLSYEAAWMEDVNIFRENRKRAFDAVSLTLWLEYFASCVLGQAESISQSIIKPKTQILDIRESFWKLNERQRATLGLLDSPQTTITNRQIQKQLKTSQITASRDLSKLTDLGLIFSHGKGRSVYYTKI